MSGDLTYLLERTALQDVVTRYCVSVDRLGEIDNLLALFTPDATIDMTALNFPRLEGIDAIRGFFEATFTGLSHSAHLVSNFHVLALEETDAHVKCYVTGMGHGYTGSEILVYVWYDVRLRKIAGEWKIAAIDEGPLMPLPGSVGEV